MVVNPFVRKYHKWSKIRKQLKAPTHCNPKTREPWWFEATRLGLLGKGEKA